MSLYDNFTNLRGRLLAVGFSTGHVLVYDFDHLMQENSGTQNVEFLHKFNLHKNSVASLAFDKTGSMLASGGFDTYIIIYDIVDGASLYKLLGHKDIVTQLQFNSFSYLKSDKSIDQEERIIQSKKSRRHTDMLISSSKDASIKVWDLESQFCAQSIMDTNLKINCFSIIANLLITGSEDENLRVYKCGIKQEVDQNGHSYLSYAEFIGQIAKNSGEKTVEISLSPDNKFILVTSAHGQLDVLKMNTEKDIYKKLLRAEKRMARKRTHSEMEEKDAEESKAVIEGIKY